MLPKSFFISGFSINGESLSDYVPLEITKEKPYIELNGLLTSYYKGEMLNGREIIPRLLIQLSLVISDNPKNFVEDIKEIPTHIQSLDVKSAALSAYPSLKKPALFTVRLNPFREPSLNFKSLSYGNYYFQIAIFIDTKRTVEAESLLVANVPGKFKYFGNDGDKNDE
ncbi:hypothetical protein [Lentilactobacillus hilgardii]|jgi:hypothetical protein|uniref:Uncharacterized protein n=1 Tax=Lentilactobacillus hilgardii TaxID=1588 RepID=A0A6P1E299_LENHI|nr:hypothetical protein [Lentilactobacillus hilgardii]EEI71652.1 hypothetical protein HMPREF0496_1071 [Lentilactobacillus hilgardii ATCC 27305]MCT3392872.1 hypothetical protein [Lentilactobacillus hilgardii]QHB51436.1 hypothetical protein GQR93_03990 [Lentilactobacillus hilgardii]RRG08908.1 MAG: hypothetical protein DUD35_10875 [Lactobacillus sp.]